MSFNINFNKPQITGAQGSQDGGAGNLGYMKNKNSQKQESNSIFEEEEKGDSFTKTNEFKKEMTFHKMLMIRLRFYIRCIKKFFSNLLH